ncbi:MAG TPA: hypothetical protein VG939_05035 [Caulobacteraceae bacterium]|nr:hypothetical protein [Caulobacteraceae bacterium]
MSAKAIALMVAALGAAAVPAGPRVPATMQGVWGKHGRCDALATRLTITARTAGWGRGPFARVTYDPEFGAVFWAEPGTADNFVLGRTTDVLVHNTQGFHVPGEEGYARCGRRLTRRPWPPR